MPHRAKTCLSVNSVLKILIFLTQQLVACVLLDVSDLIWFLIDNVSVSFTHN